MEGTVYLLGVDRAALLLSGIKPVLQSQSVQFSQPRGQNWVVCALERQLGVWLRVLPFHTVPSSLVTESVALNFQKGSSATLAPLSQSSVQLWSLGQRNLRRTGQRSVPSKVTGYFG